MLKKYESYHFLDVFSADSVILNTALEILGRLFLPDM